jgi:diketogulonate reductase-like aldo/keto reductase
MMLSRPIPSSGEPIPVIGLGTWQAFDIGTDAHDVAQRRAVLDAFFNSGGTLIDSSPMYGRAEGAVGSLLSTMTERPRAFLATKVWTTGEQQGIAQMRDSARKMRADPIDLMQVHNLVDWRTHLRTLRQWKDQGKVRYIGITHYTVAALDDLERIIRAEPVDFVQLVYSIGTRAAEHRVLPLAAERGVAVIANKPLGSGAFMSRVRGKPVPAWAAKELDIRSWAQFMLKYIVGHPAVTCAIPATAVLDHMRDNAAAGHGRLPDAAQRVRMASEWDAL